MIGHRTATRNLATPDNGPRLLGWVLGGIIIFLSVALGIFFLDRILGNSTHHAWDMSTAIVTLGGFVGAIVGIYDTRIRKRTRELERRERELERKNQRLHDFASILSHDLRNPLNVAKGRLSLAQQAVESEHLDQVDRALERMDGLINHMLELSKMDEQIDSTEPVALRDITHHCWENVDTKAATLEVTTDASIRAHEPSLKQLFENLIRNAVEHAGEDVHLTIGEMETGFYVADDGPGISESYRSQVFDPGFSTVSEGTGFGLAIVKRIVDEHGWEISVSESQSGGTRFEITNVDFV
ncbi:MAG: sensor histidine kinase [Halobacteriaceae archaeon]